jgi:hypothetical protein
MTLTPAFTAITMTSCGPERSGLPVEFIVPDGFHGIFVIKEDRNSGAKPEYVEGRVRYTVPVSGVLHTADVRPLRRWHSESAKYLGGKVIPNAMTATAEDHVLYPLTSDNDGQITYLIGTKHEYDKYWKDFVIWFRIEAPKS